jgi:hypothetical protein
MRRAAISSRPTSFHLPPEGLLGVTDFLKRRVTLPFRGNLAEFRHTMRHELARLSDQSGDRPVQPVTPVIRVAIPLWWTEGLADYWSAGEDVDEMILRDLVPAADFRRTADLRDGGIVYPLADGFIVGSAKPTAIGGCPALPRPLAIPDVRGCHPGDLRPKSGPALRRVSALHAESVLSGERGDVPLTVARRSPIRRSSGRNADKRTEPTPSTPLPRAASSPDAHPLDTMVAPIHWW